MTKISTLLTINRLSSVLSWPKSIFGAAVIALLFTLGFSVNPIESQAQTTVTCGIGQSGYYHLGPIARSSGGSSCYRQGRWVYWYPKEELLSKGLLPGARISSIGFDKFYSGNITGGEIRLKISAGGSGSASSALYNGGGANTDLASNHLANATLVHDETYDVNNNLPQAAGWWTITFDAPFTWTGDTLWIIPEFEHDNVAGTSGTSSYVQLNTLAGRMYWRGSWFTRPNEQNPGQVRYNGRCSTTKTFLPANTHLLSSLNNIRPNTQFTFINCVELTCPADQTLNGTCNGITANWTAPTPVLNCGGTANLVQTSGPAIGSLLPVGTTVIGYRADDGNDNEAECSFNITVNDGGLPTIACPADQTVTGIESTCDAVVNFSEPNAQDNCPNFSVEQLDGLPSGSSFPRNLTENIWEITDIFGNTASCVQNITVNVTDITPPINICPADETISTDETVVNQVGRTPTTSFPQSGVFLVSAPTAAQTVSSVTLFVENWCGSSTNLEVWWSPLGISANPNTICGSGGWIPLACQPHTGSTDFGLCSSANRAPVKVTFPFPLVIPAGQQYSFAVISTNSLMDLGYISTSTEWVEDDGNLRVQSHDGGSSTSNLSNNCVGNGPNPARGCVDGFSSSFYQLAGLFEYIPATTCFASHCVDLPSVVDNCNGVQALVDQMSPITDYAAAGATNPWPSGFVLDLFPMDVSSHVPPAADVDLVVVANGDHNSSTEFYDILDENGNLLLANVGQFQGNSSCSAAQNTTRTISIPVATYTAWMADGLIHVKLRARGSGINLGFCDKAWFSVAYKAGPSLTNNVNEAEQICGEFGLGTHSYEYYATDGDGNQSTCTVNFTVKDLVPPVLNCPPDANIVATPGACTAAFAYSAPTATDLCSANNTVVSIGGFGAGGNVYPTGVNVETWQATDDAGNVSTCSFEVIVGVPTPNPSITCPTDISTFTDADVCGTTVNYPAPVAIDNCPGWVVTQITGFASGTLHPEGVTTNTFRVQDGGLQVEAECEFTVTVIDDDPPSITCPANIIQPMSLTGTGECAAAVTAELEFFDNCPELAVRLNTGNLEITSTGQNHDVSFLGEKAALNNVTVSLFVTGDFSASSEYTDLIDEDGNQVLRNLGGGSGDCNNFINEVQATISAADWNRWNSDGNVEFTIDNSSAVNAFCALEFNRLEVSYLGGPEITNDYNNTFSASDIYPLGTTVVIYKLTDPGGNSADCSFNVTVVDDVAPTITCPGYITQREATSTYYYTGGSKPIDDMINPVTTAEIYIDRNTAIVDINIVELKGDHSWVNDLTFVLESPEGTQVPFWGGIICNSGMAWDMGIDDEASSSIPCPASDLILGNFRSTGPGTLPLSDFDGENMEGSWVLSIFDNASFDNGTFNGFGLEVTYIEDYQVPQDITVIASAGECQAVATYGSPVSDDNCVNSTAGGAASNFGSGATFPGGINIERFIATDDGGNTSDCTIKVQVVDDAAPLITCPEDYILNTEAGECVNSSPATLPAIFDCAPTNNVQDPDVYVLGNNTVTWVITDVLNGKSTDCSFNITIIDEELPVLNCPPNQILSTDPGTCESTAFWTAPIGVDNCPDVVTNQVEGPPQGSVLSQGIYNVSYEAFDGSGNSAACGFTIEVQDLVLPAIVCPPSKILYSDVNCETTIWYTAPGFSDNCPNAVLSLVSGLGVGPTVVTGDFYTEVWQVVDFAGNVSSCDFDVTVIDQFPPTIECPADINVGTSSDGTGNCTAVVNFPAATASDNCAPAPTVSQTSGPSSGTALAPGSHTVWFSAVDRDGNAVNCSFDITVEDDEMPTLNCPTPAYTSIVVVVGVTGANFAFPPATGSDNCASNITNDWNGTNDMSGFFPVGRTEVMFYNTDPSGNQVECGPVVVEVFDVVCPPDAFGSAGAGSCFGNVTTGVPSAFGGSISYTNSQNGGANASGNYPVGTTVVTYYIMDGTGATTACTFNVHVDEPIAPIITVCPSDLVVQTEPNRCTKRVHYNLLGSDNCPGEYWELRSGLASPGDFAIGTTTVINALVDAAGNEALCEFTVTVEDNDPPFFTLCPQDVTSTSLPNLCGGWAVWTPPTINDNCSADVTASHNPGDFFPVGVTVVSYNAIDAGGNNAVACTLNVTVFDVEDPQIACPADMVVSNDQDACNALVNYATPSANDNCPGFAVSLISGQGGGTYAVGGPYTETWEVVDASGNDAQCSFTISVEDNQKPTIACQPNIALGTNAGSCGALYFYGSASGADNCPGVVVNQTQGQASGTVFPVGVTQIQFRATDVAGNWAECSYEVTVSDNEFPAVTCPADEVLDTDRGACSAVFNYTTPSISDNCPGAQISQTGGLGSGSAFPLGITTESFVIADAAGNNVNCEFTVTVLDQEDPTIQCPSDMVSSNDFRSCDAVMNYQVTFDDNCTGAVLAQESGLTSGSAYPVGVTTHAFRVTDGAGLEATCGFSITVNDTENPEIACPSDMTAATDDGLCSAVVTFNAASASDNCPSYTVVQFGGLLSGSAFPEGVTTNDFGVIDDAGNIAICEMEVEVFDLELPGFTCPADYTIVLAAGECEYVFDQEPQVIDNCLSPSEFIINATHRNGDTLRATDGGITEICFDAGEDSLIFAPTYGVLITDVIQFNTQFGGGHVPLPFGMFGDDFTQIANMKNIEIDISGWQFERQSSGTFDDRIYNFPSGLIIPAGGTIVLRWGTGVNNPSIGYYNTGGQSNSVFSSQQCGYVLSDTLGNIIDVVATNGYSFVGDANPAPTADDWSGSITTPPGASQFNPITRVGRDNNLGSDWENAWIGHPVRLGQFDATWTRTVDREITECCFTVTVIDENGATITCPENIVVGTDEGECGAVVEYDRPAVEDLCGGASEKTIASPVTPYNGTGSMPTNITTDLVFAGTIPGALASVNWVWYFNGDHGSAGIEDFQIEDENGMVIRSNINSQGMGDCADDTVQMTFSAAQWNAWAIDGSITFSMRAQGTGINYFCDDEAHWEAKYLGDLTAGLISGFAPGSFVPVGTHSNTYGVDDGAGNITECSFDITVEDDQDPDCLLEIPPTLTTSKTAAAWSGPQVHMGGGLSKFEINVTADGIVQDVNVARLRVQHGWVLGVDFAIVSPEGTKVQIHQDLFPYTSTGDDHFDMRFDDESGLAWNQMPLGQGGAGPIGNPFCTPASFLTNTCAPGPYYRPYNPLSAFDGEEIQGIWTLEVFNEQPSVGSPYILRTWEMEFDFAPNSTFQPLGDIIVDADPGVCGAVVDYGNIFPIDNCPDGISATQTSGFTSFSLFPGGTTRNEWLVTDGAGNTTGCGFNLTVRDNTPPAIVCPPSVVVPNDPGACDAVVTHPPVTGSDNCPGWSLQQIAGLPSGATYPVGVTTNTYIVVDAQNNVQPCTFTIEVKDWEAPSITCRNAVVFPTHPTAPFPVNPATLFVGGTDNCDPTGGNLVAISIDPSTVSCANPIVQATITVQDAAGNSAQCTGTIIVDCAPLSVEVLSFTGYNENGKNILDWTTLTEINSDYFVVEKSLDGVNFEAIGKVGAAGNSSARLDYSLVDHFPAVGANYYRLKMVDLDASFEYSNVIVIDVVEAFEITNLIPNPTNGEVAIFFTADFDGELKLDLYNMTGQLVHTEMITASRGVNSWKLDLSTYAEGVYNIVLDNNKLQVRKRVVKQ